MDKSKIQIIGAAKSHDEELRQWLENHIKAHPHLTTNVLSRENYTGVTRNALDSYIKGTYFLSKEAGGMGVKPENSKLERQVRAYREKVEGTERHGYVNSFVESRTWEQMRSACDTAIRENVIVVVYGKPGVGKSRSLLEYSTRKMTTAAIEVLCSANITTKYFVQKIAKALALNDKASTAQLEDMIGEKLKKYPRPLFVDQANYLNEKALGSICYIWELARIPIVLAGTKDLHDLFMQSRLTEDVRAQLSSRVAMHYPLAELTKKHCIEILKNALGKDATDENIALIMNVTKGIHRHIDMIIPRIFELKDLNQAELEEGSVLLEDLIFVAGNRLMAS